jgi:hypothetical protein
MPTDSSPAEKVPWAGRIKGVQPRIRLTRSYNERQHTYQGYVLRVDGNCGGKVGEFLVAVGKDTHQKHMFQVGTVLSGVSVKVADSRLEFAEYYKTSGIQADEAAMGRTHSGPPFHGVPPELETYQDRGCRRLDARTYMANCTTCIWACPMPVEIIIDHWNAWNKEHRFESFCYGPKSCPLYQAGPTRKVPARKGLVWEEEDWVDEDATSHRSWDD